jgi:hypothetical protein
MSKTTGAGVGAGVLIAALLVGLMKHWIDKDTFQIAATTVTGFALALIGKFALDDNKKPDSN